VTQGNGNPIIPDQSADTDSLDKLLVTVAQGEHSAFDALFKRLSGPVYLTALTVTNDRAQAEEVGQEVLMEIWRTADRFDPARGSAAAWALTIARRRAIDRVRSTVAEAARERRDGEVPPAWDQVSETVEEIIDRERLTSSLDSLSGPQRQAIVLAFYDGHTHSEIAVILGVAVGTVKSRIRVGLERLRDSMHGVRLPGAPGQKPQAGQKA
jgi:RNA polymerase sigma-70 factor (ECF subfamily)